MRTGNLASWLAGAVLFCSCGSEVSRAPIEVALVVEELAPCHGRHLTLKIALEGERGTLTFGGNTGVSVAETTRTLEAREVRLVREALAQAAALPDESLPKQLDASWMLAGRVSLTTTSADGASTTRTGVSPLSEDEWAVLTARHTGEPPPPRTAPAAPTRTRVLHHLVKQLTDKAVADFSD